MLAENVVAMHGFNRNIKVTICSRIAADSAAKEPDVLNVALSVCPFAENPNGLIQVCQRRVHSYLTTCR